MEKAYNYIEGKVIRLNNHKVERVEVEGKSINIYAYTQSVSSVDVICNSANNITNSENIVNSMDIRREKTCIQFGFLMYMPEKNMHIVFDSLPLPNTILESLELYEQTIDIFNGDLPFEEIQLYPKIITLNINARDGDKIRRHTIEVYYEMDGFSKENACSLRIGKEYIYSKHC